MTAEKLVELFESEAKASLKRRDRFDFDQGEIDIEVEKMIEYLFKMPRENED